MRRDLVDDGPRTGHGRRRLTIYYIFVPSIDKQFQMLGNVYASNMVWNFSDEEYLTKCMIQT